MCAIFSKTLSEIYRLEFIDHLGLNLSYEKHDQQESRNTKNKTKKDEFQKVNIGDRYEKMPKKNSDKYRPLSPVEKFEAEKGMYNECLLSCYYTNSASNVL